MIKREEWQAMEPRHIQRVNGLANNVIVWHTGPDTCNVLGLSGSNCQRCIQDEACMKEHLAAFQAADLSKSLAFDQLLPTDYTFHEISSIINIIEYTALKSASERLAL